MANQENNNIGIEIIESGIARFGISAIGTIKTGIGFGLKHTGSGIVWAGRHVQDAGASLQISGMKQKYSAAISSILASQASKETKETQLAEATKSAFEKIKELAGEVSGQIDSYTDGKTAILEDLAKAKESIKVGRQAFLDIMNDCDAEIEAVAQSTAQPVQTQPASAPKTAATTQTQPTANRNLDEEAFADC